MKMDWKAFVPQDLKMGEDGSFSALFAPFLSVDKHTDVTLPGAFGKQAVVISAYGHESWFGRLPVGKGVIQDGQLGGVVEAKFFLDTSGGNDTYKTVKQVGDLQEWSYALPEMEYEYMKLKSLLEKYPNLQMNGHGDGETVRVIKKVTVPEVSPVLMGAGEGTRTLAIKSASIPLIEHIKAVSDDARELVERIKAVAALRDEKGAKVSPVSIKESLVMKALFEELIKELDPVFEKHDALTGEIARFYEILNKGREYR